MLEYEQPPPNHSMHRILPWLEAINPSGFTFRVFKTSNHNKILHIPWFDGPIITFVISYRCPWDCQQLFVFNQEDTELMVWEHLATRPH